ncbi:MAG: hypothetical protein KF774_15875 [Planctomyces sp.]|nr:hypothetical protein [Planctomyces sp.]
MFRQPGPIGVGRAALPVPQTLVSPPSRPFSSPSPRGQRGLNDDQRQLLRALADLAAALKGAAHASPAPEDAAASGEHGAPVGLELVPTLGALERTGRLERFVRQVSDAVEECRVDARFADAARPLLTDALRRLSTIPLDSLSGEVRGWVARLLAPLAGFAGIAAALAASKSEFDEQVDRMLIARFGSIQNLGTSVRTAMQQVVELLNRHSLSEQQMLEAITGIDLHSPVRIMTLRPGERLVQATQNGRIGAWFVRAGGGVGPERTGISRGGRQNEHFEVVRSIDALETRAASVMDTWTSQLPGVGGVRVAARTVDVDPGTGRIVMSDGGTPQYRSQGGASRNGVPAHGGGTQLFLPALARQSNIGDFGLWTSYLKRIR